MFSYRSNLENNIPVPHVASGSTMIYTDDFRFNAYLSTHRHLQRERDCLSVRDSNPLASCENESSLLQPVTSRGIGFPIGYNVRLVMRNVRVRPSSQGRRLRGDSGGRSPNLRWGDGAAYIPPIFLKYFMNIIIIAMSDSWFLSALKL